MKVFIPAGAGLSAVTPRRGLATSAHQVILYGNLSCVGADSNLDWLRHHRQVEFIHSDVRNLRALCDLLQARHFDAVIHLAAQVAVTTPIIDPEHDFEVNARGTFNVLEAAASPARCDRVERFDQQGIWQAR